MTRAVQILERCITSLERITFTDPLQPGVRYILTRGLPETLDHIRGDLEFLRGLLEKEK